jgi:hypothetical protein
VVWRANGEQQFELAFDVEIDLALNSEGAASNCLDEFDPHPLHVDKGRLRARLFGQPRLNNREPLHFRITHLDPARAQRLVEMEDHPQRFLLNQGTTCDDREARLAHCNLQPEVDAIEIRLQQTETGLRVVPVDDLVLLVAEDCLPDEVGRARR